MARSCTRDVWWSLRTSRRCNARIEAAVGLKRNTVYNVAGAASSIVVALATIPPYLHQIGEARYGVLALVWLLLGYFGLFDLGLSRATANHIARLRGKAHAEQEAVFWTAMILNLGLGVIGGLVLYFAGGPLLYHWLKASPAVHAEAVAALPWIAAAVPVATSTAVMTGALTGQQRFGVVNLVQVGGMLLFQTVPLLVAFAIGPALYIIIPAAVLARSVVLVPLFLAVKRMLPLVGRPRVDRARARELLGYGAWVTVTNVVGPILSTFDRFFIGAILGAASVAYYDVPFRLAQKAQIVPGALSQALFPRLSGETQGNAAATSFTATAAINGFMTPLAVVAILLMDPFLTLWVGVDFARRATPVGLALLLGTWANSLAFIPFAKLQAEGRPGWVAKVHLLEVVPYVAGLWWALNQFGLVGAAFAWTARATVDAALLFWLSRISHKVWAPLAVSGVFVGTAWVIATVHLPLAASISVAIVLIAASGYWGLACSTVLRSGVRTACTALRAHLRDIVGAPDNPSHREHRRVEYGVRNEK